LQRGFGFVGRRIEPAAQNPHFTQARRRKIGHAHAYNQWTKKGALSCEYGKVQFNSISIYETIH
jgi:hypothetical protein